MAPEQLGLPILTIGGHRGQVPPQVRPDGGTGLEIWRDGGAVVAYGYRTGERYWLELLGVATYGFSSGSREVVAYPEEGVAESRVADGFERAALPLALHVNGHEVLHASAVLTSAGVVAFCATAGTGKSTLAYGLSRRGHALWADDAVPFAARDDGASTFRVPFTLRLLEESRAHFGQPAFERSQEDGEAELAAVCVLTRGDQGEPTELERLSPRDAFTTVLPHAYAFTAEEPQRNRRMLEAYGALVNTVPVFRVTIRTGFEYLDELLGAIEAATAIR
jgi:hypothetical protein